MDIKLHSQKEILNQGGWLADMGSQILSRFDKEQERLFPCLFARKAFAQNMVKFLPVPYLQSTQNDDFNALTHGLTCYLDMTFDWDGKFNTAYPLLVVFEPNPHDRTTKNYQKIFIDTLQYLIDNDTKEWLGEIPLDPNQEFWTMCFHGVQLFINASHPNHHLRASRNLCDTLVLVINPRERFDIFAGDNDAGYAIREQIRKNIDNYDLIPRSPCLGHYLLGEQKWVQYMLPITNDDKPLECPLSFSKCHHARSNQ